MNSLHAQICKTLLDFFANAFQRRTLKVDDDVFALGFGNSLFVMQLVEFVERSFNIDIEDDDLDLNNFKTVTQIADLVMQKKEGDRFAA